MARVSPHLFQLVLACSWLATLFAAAQESSSTAEDGPRGGAELDPYETVMFAAAAGSPTSDLFSSCLESDRTAEVKLYSIEATDGKEFFRFVPDEESLKLKVDWSSITDVEINSIYDCAVASSEKGSSMFKYQAGACQVSDQLYDIDHPAACEDSDTEAVFLLPGSSPCPPPAFDVSSDPTNQICAIAYDTGDAMIQTAQEMKLCPSSDYVIIYERTGIVDMATLRQIVLDQGIGYDLAVCASIQIYCNGTPVNETDKVDTVEIAGDWLVMSAADGFFLKHVDLEEVVGHNLCVPEQIQ